MDKALKQRLVGASVLIALAVIVFPMLLGGRPEGGAREMQKIELPPQPSELNLETRRYPIGKQQAQARAGQQDEEPDRPLPAPRSQQIPADPEPLIAEETPAITNPAAVPSENIEITPIQAATAETSQQATQPSSSAPAPQSAPRPVQETNESGRYVVQVASFGNRSNANRLSGTLKSSGYSVMTDSVKSDVGTLHRVRVGPFGSEASANQAASELESKIDGVKPRVMDLQPGKSAQITSPSDPLVRWVVQVGSFSSAENADKLVASLKMKGLTAYQESIISSGSSIHRVRIGPFLERNDAIATEREVRSQMSLNGVVMTAD